MYLILHISLLLLHHQTAEIENTLEKLGYTNPPFKLQLTWEEKTPNGFVEGILLLNTNTNKYEEIYITPEGKILSRDDISLVQLKPKNWNPGYIEIPPSLNSKFKKDKLPNKLAQLDTTYDKICSLMPAPSNYITLPQIEQWEVEFSLSKEGKVIGKVKDLDEKIKIFSKFSEIKCDAKKIDRMDIKTIGFFSNNALGIRLKLRVDGMLPPQHKIIIKGEAEDDFRVVYFYNKEVWTPLAKGPIAHLYYIKPSSSSSDFHTIEIMAYGCILKDPFEELTKVASCYEDVMCYSPWDIMSSGVLGLETISHKYIIFCTGSVLSNNDPTTVSNLILTANHCVSDQAKAESLEFIWFYQSDQCKGIVPSISTVPITTGGAQLLATSPLETGTDVTLLQINNPPPDNIFEFGYTNYPISLGTDVVVIHHPGSSYKHISFGNTTNGGSPYYGGANLQPLKRFHEVKYYQSSTEAGSSGSPLIWASTGLVIGQLWGGTASCNNMTEPDYFGRFDVSYPILEPFLPVSEVNYDIDNSGEVNEVDLTYIVNSSLGIIYEPSCDLNKDGKFNASDIQLIWNQLNT
ncbi:MAG: trypsin-like peptidase domain-containing protein [Candidatus Hydrogenedentes bacterium]|nr:trypsin-like peptidase domain-containing protein [Candidatus Hydrogenedentota bacterium]